jgi:hypothetical protein
LRLLCLLVAKSFSVRPRQVVGPYMSSKPMSKAPWPQKGTKYTKKVPVSLEENQDLFRDFFRVVASRLVVPLSLGSFLRLLCLLVAKSFSVRPHQVVGPYMSSKPMSKAPWPQKGTKYTKKVPVSLEENQDLFRDFFPRCCSAVSRSP